MPRQTRLLASFLALATAVGLVGCSADEQEGENSPLTVWSLEDNTDRIAATKAIIADFTARTGINVNLVPVNEDQFPSLIASNAAAGDLPDVVGSLPLAGVQTLAGNELLHPSANGEVVDSLGRDTFSPRALELTAEKGKQLSVPSDGWGQLLVYRKDLFDAAGLAAPDTYEKITAAAAALNKGGVAGITASTAPGDVFTQQTFEHLALANNCQLTDASGGVKLSSPECVEAFRFYGELISKYSVKGAQDVDTTRATYFAGKAAMIVWSSFLLDELAGLRNDARPTCPQCAQDPTFLAKNSGFVTAIKGPGATEPAQYGEITSWAVLDGASTGPAKQFVEFMLGDGYQRWFGMAPEGKFPVRKGTKDDKEKFVNAWNSSQAGVDTKKPLSEVYGPPVLQTLRTSPDTFQRWGLPQGQGKLVGAILGELPVPKALALVISGRMDAAAAVGQAQKEVESIKAGLR
ncbi:MAG TPA: extracellular solute-binding protein [Micromonosporaceae bacterium]|nr:extracellular solute-binding protein [Micromonosporaceae bacterium]